MTKKFLKILASTLMCTTPIISVINCFQYQNSRNLGLEKYAVHQNEVTNSKYFTFNAVKADDDDSTVSLAQLNDRIAAIEDKAQYELYAAGYTKEVVYPIIGQLKANINQQIESWNENRGLSANAELDEDGIKNVYAYINNQASIFGLDVADFDKFAASIPTLAAHYENDLLSHKYSQEDALKEANDYRNDLVSILNSATENLYDNVHLALAMYPKTKTLSEETQKSYKEARLSSVLTWIKSNANSLISLRPEGLKLLADYSDDNIGLIQPGVELTSKSYDYMSNFFNYKYSVVEGWSTHQISLDDIPATTPSDEYDQEILNGTHITAPLDSLRGTYSTFNKDEILPRYKLHAKIKSINNMTDSHSCKIEFSFGVSEKDDDYVLWDDFLDSNSSDENSKIEFTATFNDFSLINNISKNVYWKDFSLTANLPTKDTPNSNGVYYSDTADIRTSIDKIMAAYMGNAWVYDLKTNPVILDDDARKGISLPTNFNANLTNNFYSNQEFALIASDIDSINNTLSINWAIIDKNVGENDHTKNDFYVIKNIPWNINGSLVDAIKVQFNISEELQNMMHLAISNNSIYNSFANLVALNEVASDENLEKTKKTLIYNSSFIGVQAACTIAIGILTTVYISRIVASVGMDVDAVAGAAVGVSIVALMTVANAFMVVDNVKAWLAYKNNKENLAPKLHKTGVYSKQINDSYNKISNDYAVVNSLDPQVTYTAKQKAAIDANNLAYKTNLLMKGEAIEKWIDRDEFKEAGFSDEKINKIINSLYEEPSYSSDGDGKDDSSDDHDKGWHVFSLVAASLDAIVTATFVPVMHMFYASTVKLMSESLLTYKRIIDHAQGMAWRISGQISDPHFGGRWTPEYKEMQINIRHKHMETWARSIAQRNNLKSQMDVVNARDVALNSSSKWYPIVITVISAIDVLTGILQEVLKPHIIK